MRTGTKIKLGLISVLVLGLGIFVFFKFYFVLGEGVKAGELNQFIYKGWVWKTYEGRLIQAGFKGAKTGGSIQSNEFNFSVDNKDVADKLMRCSGKTVELRYREYNGMLPWRGMQKYVVYEVLSVNDSPSAETLPDEIPMEQ